MSSQPAYDPRYYGSLCHLCPLSHDKKPVPPGGNTQAQIMIIGEAPGYIEEKKLEPFIGPSGAKLDELLWKVGVRRKEVWVSNAILCRPEVQGEKPNRRFKVDVYMAHLRKSNKVRRKLKQPEILDPFTCCKPRLDWEIQQLEQTAKGPNGIVLVPMGNYALKAVTAGKDVGGKVASISKMRGSVLEVKP